MNTMGMGMPPQVPIQSQNPQMQQQQQQQQQQQPLDNISKIKAFMGPLRESLSNTIKTAAQTLNQNSQIDVGTGKGIDRGVDAQIPRFDKNLEEFYSLCDQIELHLKTSIKCLSQGESSSRYLNLPVAPTRSENIGIQDNTLTYPQFLAAVNDQVTYTKEIHDTLVAAAQNISPSD